MRTIIESFLIFILLLYISFLSMEYVAMNLTVEKASSFHTACIDSIENNDYDSSVINAWIEKGEKYGFDVNVVNISKLKLDEVVPCYYVSLTYNVKLNLLGIEEEATIKGYAR